MKKRALTAALLAALFLLLTGCAAARQGDPPQGPEPGEMRVTFFDVGKGDCILLEKDGAFLLIDAGYAETAPEVTAFLRERGVASLDAVIVTHYDKDHAGGVPAVLQAVPAERLYLPGYEGGKQYQTLIKTVLEQDLPYRQVTEDVSFALAGAEITICASDVAYVPAGEKEANDNDVSLVISAVYGSDSYLFAGDLEKEGIASYLTKDRGRFDVVKMPHHGDKKKNTGDFITDVSPKIAVITDSAEEPAEDGTLSLLTKAGAKVFRTSVQGTVTVTGTGVGRYKVS